MVYKISKKLFEIKSKSWEKQRIWKENQGKFFEKFGLNMHFKETYLHKILTPDALQNDLIFLNKKMRSEMESQFF